MGDSARSNSRLEDEFEPTDELESSDVDEESQMKPPETLRVSQMATVYPPKPCERCIRMNRTCKGIAGSRCEYCRRLKQKCSNATGPARGRHATRLAMLAAAAAQGRSPPPQPSSAAGGSSWAVRPKRKATFGKATATAQSGGEEEYDGDGHEPPMKLNKKRRSGKAAFSPFQSKMLDHISELEDTVRRLQSHTAREVERINEIIARLKADVRDVESAD